MIWHRYPDTGASKVSARYAERRGKRNVWLGRRLGFKIRLTGASLTLNKDVSEYGGKIDEAGPSNRAEKYR